MTGVVEAFEASAKPDRLGRPGCLPGGRGGRRERGSSVEAVDDDIDITPGVRARGTPLPVNVADICRGHGLAEPPLRWWGGGDWRRWGLVAKVVLLIS